MNKRKNKLKTANLIASNGEFFFKTEHPLQGNVNSARFKTFKSLMELEDKSHLVVNILAPKPKHWKKHKRYTLNTK